MRLLHTKDITLREFSDADHAPPYAILSHVWREQEVLFTHMQNPEEAQKRLGFSKVLKCCEKARAAGYDWVWIDTCCIDKASSAELSEAINSMFAWYKKARVCYAYLDNVAPGGLPPRGDFEHSRWFTRGWTLQELIAPAQVMFLAQDWSEIGTRGELVESIEHVTRVDRSVLLGRPVQLASRR
ncbi:hypothetical protein A0H81_10553 [Grifola frondosa]|uniref:Heterokaryon incompatibility domain-containing protein n=1 Tax=Grifola frondosa TaxID=5627 RepID=A0A1C7LZB9_GRIFR|nr:hypothetical protein A0H81_10553 [Grifola frondosa]